MFVSTAVKAAAEVATAVVESAGNVHEAKEATKQEEINGQAKVRDAEIQQEANKHTAEQKLKQAQAARDAKLKVEEIKATADVTIAGEDARSEVNQEEIKAKGAVDATKIETHAEVAGQSVQAVSRVFSQVVKLGGATIAANSQVTVACLGAVQAVHGAYANTVKSASESENRTKDNVFKLAKLSIERGGATPHKSLLALAQQRVKFSRAMNNDIIAKSDKRLSENGENALNLATRSQEAHRHTLKMVGNHLKGESSVMKAITGGITIGLGAPSEAPDDM
ncbi:hypothetical protein BC830DRAFT_1175882 [Chytriomyces sp. MP71]|nr:hypothetical protein BC830DRAFT_1175882 [Chytriomyces sp. MP71]